ncbi:MAG: T9SS type A sorting domain-containing protein, partial [Candidatus Cloacimonetes bacterium]|nr:T9SS type A sorting domain-containing protein [Candidatus Cloacimonadota bacterium]
NYPNPFSTLTTISFNIATDLHRFSQIKIYNIKGQLVKQLKLQKAKGKNNIIWDGKDEKDNQVSSGLYFYQLKIGNKIIDTKKCIFLK